MKTSTVYKYQLKTTDLQTLQLRAGSELLTVQVQNEQPCLWVRLDPEEQEFRTLLIRTYGTGHLIYEGDEGEYLGTYQLHEGSLAFHCFASWEEIS